MAYDRGLVERVADILGRLGRHGIRQKNVFSGWGFLSARSTFLIVHRDGLIVKITPAQYQEALTEAGVKPFAPGGERPMGTWVVVPGESVTDDPELAAWVERGLRAVHG